MIKKLFLTLILIFTAYVGALALTGAEIMQKTAAKVTSAPSLTVTFTATGGDGAKATGVLTMAKARFKMETTAQSVWYDGRTMWSYSPSAKETTVSEPLPEELMEINPFDILNQYTTRYTIKKLTPLGKDHRIELTARKGNQSVKRVVLVIDPATMLPKAIDVSFASSARMNILISSCAIGKALPKSTFTYPKAKYPKAEVVDLR